MPRELLSRLCEERDIVSNSAAPTCASVYGYGDKLEGYMWTGAVLVRMAVSPDLL